jgi:glycosyltransferase involved in cell wall biosynthesis
MSIAVVIPTYNFGRFLAAAIDGALAQSVRPDEVVVIDDGSTDETADVVSRFAEVRYVKQGNMGVCVARNRGVASTSSDYIAFLDADDIWEPTKLERQMEKFRSDAQVGLVHCGMSEFDSDTGEIISFRLEGLEGWIADELLLWERPAVNVSGSSIMVTRAAFDEAGGFDPEITVGEDWDFVYRVARLYKVGFVSDPLIRYRSHAHSAHRNIKAMEKGMSRFYEKAFADPSVARLRSRSLSNFHRVLAGSYFHSRSYPEFVKHALKSFRYSPSQLSYFLKYPWRRLGA